VKYRVGLTLCSLVLLVSERTAAQQTPPADTARPSPIGVRVRLGGDTVALRLPTVRLLAERESFLRAREQIAAARATAFQQNMRTALEAAWGQIAAQSFATQKPAPAYPSEHPPRPRIPTVGERAAAVVGDYADLAINLAGRVEVRGEQTRNARCAVGIAFDPVANCRSGFEPLFDFQAALRSGGVIADRVNVNVDYDSQREFESSNTISIAYSGKDRELLERFEIGNVTFQPPRSQFITSGIPSNNTGLQAIARVGALRIRGIIAQQKGHVIRDRTFTIGDRTLKAIDRAIEDSQFEPRRFFFTVDPELLSGYPNVDLLDPAHMQRVAAALPDTARPSRLYLYRLLIGGQPPNPSGPQFRILGDPRSRRGPVYEYLREGVDYYADPSLLWIALVRPLAINNERLVVAYRVRANGVDTVHVTTGGTPDLAFTADREQFANLLWDPHVKPGDAAFDREIRSIYRVGGSDIVRNSLSVKVVTGPNEDQEKPLTGTAETYLQLFGLAQPTNSSNFDVENRLWPRPTDPNLQVSFGGGPGRTIRDQFLFFPSVRPFARSGLTLGNPSNDAVYSTPAEHFNTPRRPSTVYHVRVRYQAVGSGDGGAVMLGSVQLRPNSERITVDGVPLVRGVDYTVDYDLGRVSFTRPDTLFQRPRQVTVHYEENPLFADTPTSIAGGTAELILDKGEVAITALSQTQKTTFNRPPLGFEPASALIGGISASFSFDADPLRRLVSRLPWGETSVPARVSLSGEFAVSSPKPNKAGQAYLESFEGEGGLAVSLEDRLWYYSSQPAIGGELATRLGANVLQLERASTLAWQSSGLDTNSRVVTYSIAQIDPQTQLFGAGVTAPEQLLWMTLYPISIRGLLDEETRTYRWRTPTAVAGRRWRSIRTQLGASGTDLTRAENLEFWVQIPTAASARGINPVLVFDFGDISENSVAFAPDTAMVRLNPTRASIDTLFSGSRVTGLDRLDSERDPFSRAFNVTVNDRGLPGDLIDSITVVTDTAGAVDIVTQRDFALCSGGRRVVHLLGDSRANCTVRNRRLDEEDLDSDNVLNLTATESNAEEWRRYVVDLATTPFVRRGQCSLPAQTLHRPAVDSVCWVLYRIPFRSPSDSLGAPVLRRTRALRVTMISSSAIADHEFQQIAIARLRLTGAAWLKRDDRVLRGIGGAEPAAGFVAAGVIGTQDRNLPGRVNYESPPGVVDEPDVKTAAFSPTRVQINERSLQLTAGGLEPAQRAEAYYTFPEGDRNFLGYKELRLWARGIGNGWGEPGELNFYVRLGRDVNNFYLYRTPLNGGDTRVAWLPEIRVNFDRIIALRAELQNAFLQGTPANTCTGPDSVLIAATPVPAGAGQLYAACSDGYVVFTIDPIASAPNLASVQELSIGMVRIPGGTSTRPISGGDTLELWVDDIRLGGVVDEPGFAGQVGATIIASDFADVRANFTRRDAHFRQIGERPTYLASSGVDVTTALRLEKLLPRSFGLSIPVTLSYNSAADDPLFLSQSDIEAEVVQGLRSPRSRATSYTMQVRRAQPVGGSLVAAILDNLALNSSYTSARAQSEYQSGSASRLTIGLDFNVSRALFPAASRWMPAELYVTSGFTRARDDREAFLRPAESVLDPGTKVRGDTKVWKNGTVIALRPWNGVGARLDVSSVRDLRDYDPSTPLGVVGVADRGSVAGLDVGAERERAIQASLTFAPAMRGWIRPRFDFLSTYSMVRDPNTPFFTRPPDAPPEQRVPRRLANTQTITAGATVDLASALTAMGDSGGFARAVTHLVRPLDVTINRHVLSLYDAIAVAAPLSYQFAFGGAAAFRAIRGSPATAAGVNNQLTAAQELRLPLGATLVARYQQVNLRNWTRRFDQSQAVTDGAQIVFPDLALRWSGRPRGLSAIWSNIALTARALETQQEFGTPLHAVTGLFDDRGALRTRSYPVTLASVWSAIPGLTTNVTFARTRRNEVRPGLNTRARSQELSFDIGKEFALPQQWDLRSPLRTRLSYENTEGSNFVVNPLAFANLSRVTDNGRRAWTLTADTDVAENLASSFVVSRVLSFDRNLDRRFTQTILSAVLHMQFFGGEVK
jgi:hypothetical protein